MFLIVQITDTHISTPQSQVQARHDTAGHLARAVAFLNALTVPPDIVIATGDLVEDGTPAEYAVLADILRDLSMPVYLLMGNHDDRAALRAGFPGHRYLGPGDGPVQYAIEDHPLRLVGLDTTIPGRSKGQLDDARLDWLADTLAARPDAPTLLMVHHPAFPVGLDAMDRSRIVEGAERLAALVADHPQIVRIVSGHLHMPIVTLFGGRVWTGAPATAHQIDPDLRPGVELMVAQDPPAVLLHRWDGARLVTHTRYVGDYPRAPYRG